MDWFIVPMFVDAMSLIGAATGGWLAAESTWMLLTTVFTPCTWPASLAAAVRSRSLFALPERVTTPWSDVTLICLLGMLASALILLCTSLATCTSLRVPSDAKRSQPLNNAINTITKGIKQYSCLHIAPLFLRSKIVAQN